MSERCERMEKHEKHRAESILIGLGPDHDPRIIVANSTQLTKTLELYMRIVLGESK